MRPLVSLCIPAFNGVRYIRECLQSALAQTFSDIEILVVDDGSQDETVRIVEEHAKHDARIRVLVNQTNLGLVKNWNRCVDLADGEWIKFLFQDDVIEPDFIERMLEQANDNIPLLVCRRQFIFEPEVSEPVRAMYMCIQSDSSISQIFPARTNISGDEFASKFLEDMQHNWIGEPTATLIHRSAFDRYGFFNPALVSLCDWEFFARVAVNAGICYLDRTLAIFRVHEQSVSGQYRSTGDYKAMYIDPLIIRHEMVYGDSYAGVRRQAAQNVPPINLKQKLLYAAREARLVAEELAYDPLEPNPKPLLEWQDTMQQFPQVNSIPLSYLVNWARGKARKLLCRPHHASSAE